MKNVVDLKLLFATKRGMVKVTEGTEFEASKRMVTATKLADGDSLTALMPVNAGEDVVLQTRDGYFLRFEADEIPIRRRRHLACGG